MLRLRGSTEEEEGGPEEPRRGMLRYSRSAVATLASKVFEAVMWAYPGILYDAWSLGLDDLLDEFDAADA